MQLSFENLLIVVEAAVESTDTRRSATLSNFIIENSIDGFWDKAQYKHEWNESLQKHDETI